jgi:hypothetical protein
MKEPSMNKLMTVALYVVLTACSATAAQAQQAAADDAKAASMQRQVEPVVHCTSNNSGVGATQPCGTRAGETLRLGSDATRQEYECVMSGVCGATDRGRVAS